MEEKKREKVNENRSKKGRRQAAALERPIADEPARDPGMPEAGPVPRGTLIGDGLKVLLSLSLSERSRARPVSIKIAHS